MRKERHKKVTSFKFSACVLYLAQSQQLFEIILNVVFMPLQ
jgi:hypothetical protein